MSKLYNLEGSPSNHSPIYLDTKRLISTQRANKNFKFENAWLTEPMCFQLVRDSWEGYDVANIREKVLQCGQNLEVWGREVTWNFGKRIKEYKLELKKLRNKTDEKSLERFKEVKQNLS